MTKADHRQMLDGIIAVQKSVLYALRRVRADLHNRSPVNPKKRTAPPTKMVRNRIISLSARGDSQQEIAHRLGISIGRVSETLRGKRR